MLFPSRKAAEHCRAFMVSHSTGDLPVRCVQYASQTPASPSAPGTPTPELHIVLFPSDAFPLAKQFWQHTGLGVSSRLAERMLASIAPASPPATPQPQQQPQPTRNTIPLKQRLTRFYATKEALATNPLALAPPQSPSPPIEDDELTTDHTTYLEERYGRNLPQCSATQAKRALRRRIAGVLVADTNATPCAAGGDNVELGPSARGVETVTEDDVFLYPTGMTAIWSAHQLALKVLPVSKSACFGFPYTDTLKILQKWGPGCHFFGHGLDSDIDELETLLKSSVASDPTVPPLLALFSEFPSNPLLRSPNLPRLRQLADKYNFLIVIDETVGNFLNVSVLPFADIVVSSLTKVFSGDSNVMGGRYEYH